MKAIPGWAYVLIGVLMAVLSKIVDSKKNPGNQGDFALFFWAGIVFIIIGIGKYAYNAVFRKDKGLENPLLGNQLKQENPPVHQGRQHQATSRAMHQSSQISQSMQPPNDFSQDNHQVHKAGQNPVQHASIIACPSCGTRHYDYAHYCMRCGTRIKSR